MPRFSMQLARDGIWLLLGTAGAINELFLRSGNERPYVLAFVATLLGIPALLSFDRKRNGK